MSLTGILCCFRPRNDTQQEDTVDERTHLIPTTTEDQPATTPNLVFIDPIQFRERLGTIVRAKEGRMVNVTPNYRSREHSLNRNSGFHRNRASSRMSSTISSARTTRSTSTPDSINVQDDSDSIVSVGGQGISRIKRIPSTELGREESEGVEESNRPTVIVSAPIIPIRQRPTIPVFDDPSVKLSVSWGD